MNNFPINEICTSSILTFELLQQNINEDLKKSLELSMVINICKESTASFLVIYRLWARKLLQIYDILDFSYHQSEELFDYLHSLLENGLNEILLINEDLEANKTNILEWCTETDELLIKVKCALESSDISECLQSSTLKYVLRSALTFHKSVGKISTINIMKSHTAILKTFGNSIDRLKFDSNESLFSFTTVVSLLSDLSAFLSIDDVFNSIELWRILAKFLVIYNREILSNSIRQDDLNINYSNIEIWYHKPIKYLMEKLHVILKFTINNETALKSENYTRLCQYYLKILRSFIIPCPERISFVLEEFHKIYQLTTFKLLPKNSNLCFYEDLMDLFVLLCMRPSIGQFILEQSKKETYDVPLIVFDYLTMCLTTNRKHPQYINNNANTLMEIFNQLFSDPFVYVDNEKYYRILDLYVAFIVLDDSGIIHRHLCLNVLKSDWILAHASKDVLCIYYRYCQKNGATINSYISYLNFWLLCCEHYFNCYDFNQTKFMIHCLLKTVLMHIKDSSIQNYIRPLPNNGENTSMLYFLYMDGNMNVNGNNPLNPCLDLKKMLRNLLFSMQQLNNLTKYNYKKIAKYLDILSHDFNNIDYDFYSFLLKIFKSSLKHVDMSTTRVFFNACFRYLYTRNNKKINVMFFEEMRKSIDQVEQIISPFSLIYLLNYRSQCSEILQKLLLPDNLRKIKYIFQQEINYMNDNKINDDCLDLEIFRYLNGWIENRNNQQSIKPIKKQINSYEQFEEIIDTSSMEIDNKQEDILKILNKMKELSENLLSFKIQKQLNNEPKFQNILQSIQNDIRKCLNDKIDK